MKTIFTLFCLLTIYSSTAQWTADTAINTLVAESGELDIQARGTSEGATYVVFWKNVAAPVDIELRMQLIDAAGNPTLGPDGILVSDELPMSTFTVIFSTVVDADDNLYIGVTGTEGGNPAYVFKMNQVGNHLWDTQGVNVGSGNVVTVLPLANGDAIVSWLSDSGAVMQRYGENGIALWPITKPITSGSGLASPGNFFELSDGNFIAVFHKLLNGINSFLFAQRYDGDGNPVWNNAVQIADRATAFIRNYDGIQDGDVVYMGYYASAGTRFDSYLQRINADGTLPWGINGSDFDTNQTNYEVETSIAFETGSDFIFSICNYTDSSQNQTGEYIQKFDKNTGARQFTENAKVVFPLGSDKVHTSSLYLKNDSPLFLIKDGFDNGVSPVTLQVVYLDENGLFVWPELTRPIATFAATKTRVNYTMPVNNQSVVVFGEDKGDGMKVYAQNFLDEELSIDDFSKTSLTFVNPVLDQFVLNSSLPIEQISIFNMLGQIVFSDEYDTVGAVEINTQIWPSGVYLMNVLMAEGKMMGVRVIKE